MILRSYNMNSSSSRLHGPSSVQTPSVACDNSKKRWSKEWHYNYSTVAGFFLQDRTEVDQVTDDKQTENNMYLIDQEYDTDELLSERGTCLTQWQRFANKLSIMNRTALDEDTYRLLYLGRHGQGYHNVGIMFYGDTAWDCYYGTFEHDPHVPTITYFDAHLTPCGRHEAQIASSRWQNLISIQKMPPPQTYYSSPLTRAMQTAQLTFSCLQLPESWPFQPLVKEALREGYGIQPCDRRPARSYIQTNFPQFRLEDSLKEHDDEYPHTRREPRQHRFRRVRALLDDVFEHDKSTYISMSSHNDTIEAMLHVVGHKRVSLPTCGTIPILVKVSKVFAAPYEDEDSSQDEVEWEGKPECTINPSKVERSGFRDIAEYLREINSSISEKSSSAFLPVALEANMVEI